MSDAHAMRTGWGDRVPGDSVPDRAPALPRKSEKIESGSLVCVRGHTNTKVKLHPGLNVVVGDSDSGKSNIVRAIWAVLCNEPAPRFLSRGATYGHAEIDFGDGTVRLTKGERVNKYIVSRSGFGANHAYSDVGSSVPEPVAEFLRMGPVTLGGEAVALNVARQRAPAFVLDESPSRVARVLGAVSGLGVVHRAIRAAVGAEGAARAAGWFDGSGPRDQAEGARAALMALSVRVRARAQSADLAAPAKLAGEDLAAVEGAESRFVDAQRREGERAEWAETFERARKWILENPWIEGFPTALKWAILAVAIGVPLLVAAYVWRTFR